MDIERTSRYTNCAVPLIPRCALWEDSRYYTELDYHYEYIGTKIGKEIKEALVKLLTSVPSDEDSKKRTWRNEHTRKRTESIVRLYHREIEDAYKNHRRLKFPSTEEEVIQDIEERLYAINRSEIQLEAWKNFPVLRVVGTVVRAKYQPFPVPRTGPDTVTPDHYNDGTPGTMSLNSKFVYIQAFTEFPSSHRRVIGDSLEEDQLVKRSPTSADSAWYSAVYHPVDEAPAHTTGTNSTHSAVVASLYFESDKGPADFQCFDNGTTGSSGLISPSYITDSAHTPDTWPAQMGFPEEHSSGNLRPPEDLAGQGLSCSFDLATYNSEPDAPSTQSGSIFATPPARILEPPQTPGAMPKDEFAAMSDFITMCATLNPDSDSKEPYTSH